MKSVRDSGLDIIGNITWGTHISHLYSSQRDFEKVLVPFILSGLVNNELCIWVYSQNINCDEVKTILETSISNIDKYIEEKKLILMPYTQWYIMDNSFNDMRVNKQWRDLIHFAVENGFDGLRAVGDTAWLEQCYKKDFIHYENNINEFISGLQFIVLCLYDVNRTNLIDIANIMNNHHLTIITERADLQVIKNIELLTKEKELEENRKLLNQMKEYEKQKSDFFSNISHELRTPLNVMLSTIQLVRQIDFNSVPIYSNKNSYDKLRKYIKIIQQNCYRQLRLVNNLIDLSKMESDYNVLKLQISNIVEIVEDITLSVVDFAESKGIELIFDTSIEEHYITCDPDQIERIILNLLSNAIKFTEPGGRINVNIQNMDEKVFIRVKDTGKGIPKDKLECIFDRFNQVDHSREHMGSGIGLSLVKSLVEKHHGIISVKSEMEVGSEFLIELPQKCSNEKSMNTMLIDHETLKNHVEKINIEFSDIYS